jgi:hypothetical protein
LLEAYRAGEQEVHEGEHVEGDKVGLSVVSSAPRLPVRSVPSHQAREGGESEDGVQTFTMPFSVVTWMIVRRQSRCRLRAEPGETTNQPNPAIYRDSIKTVGNQPSPIHTLHTVGSEINQNPGNPDHVQAEMDLWNVYNSTRITSI